MKDRKTTKLEPVAASEAIDLDELRSRATCSVDEAARLLHVGRSTAYAAVRCGDIPSLRCSGRVLIPTAKLLAMLGCDGERSD